MAENFWIHGSEIPLAFLLQEGRPFSGPRSGLLSNVEMNCLRRGACADKAGDFIGKGHLGEEQQGEDRTALPQGSDLRFYGNGVSFHVASGQSSDPRRFSCWHSQHPTKMDSNEKDSGKLVGHMD